MKTTRRTILKASAALLLPSWYVPRQRVRTIDLSLFCADDEYIRYDITSPFKQGDMTYATDARMCVRTPLPVNMGDSPEEVRLPRADKLGWRHDEITGWQSLDRARREKLDVPPLNCPTCFGKGRLGDYVECSVCEGSGEECILLDFGETIKTLPCKCKSGYVGGTVCHECRGTGEVDYMWNLGDESVQPELVAKMRTLGEVEFAMLSSVGSPTGNFSAVAFRFDGGEGIVMGLHRPS